MRVDDSEDYTDGLYRGFRRAGTPAPPDPALELSGGLPPPPGGYSTNLPVVRKARWVSWRNFWRLAGVMILLFMVAIGWLALTAPLSKSLQPPVPPSITLLSVEGEPIARTGSMIDKPVDAARLPDHVRNAFIAIEDRRFYSHWGVDPRGMTRALMANLVHGGVSQGGSTITQQLAKNAFLNSDRTAARKMREVMIAFWLEYWLTKDQILSRYLSNVYFGDNVYGLRAAARHYFSRDPEDLTTAQAAMLAGLVKAPSRLAPTNDLKAAQARQAVVVQAMVDAGLLKPDEAADVRPARLKLAPAASTIPAGTYFADWVLPVARDREGGVDSGGTVRTTLEIAAQRAAERAVRNAGLSKTEVAIVSMRTDGRVIAMVGGRNYAKSQFNRATAGNRQAGSTFKLFVYLAALRAGMTPDDMIEDKPVTIGKWKPQNSGGVYRGPITLERAFAASSNVASARITARVGPGAVIAAARDLGITTPIPDEATIALGTPSVSLLEMTAAYAAIAAGRVPVRPYGLADQAQTSWIGAVAGGRTLPAGELESMRRLLQAVVERGTGRGVKLPVPVFGKTGTTQDNRDAWFIGYSGDIVTGVWLGNDDNTPNAGLSGSGLPVRIWRDYMRRVVPGADAPVAPVPTADPEDAVDGGDGNDSEALFQADLGDGTSLSIDQRGITIDRQSPGDGAPPPPDDRRPPPDNRRPPADDRRRTPDADRSPQSPQNPLRLRLDFDQRGGGN